MRQWFRDLQVVARRSLARRGYAPFACTSKIQFPRVEMATHQTLHLSTTAAEAAASAKLEPGAPPEHDCWHPSLELTDVAALRDHTNPEELARREIILYRPDCRRQLSPSRILRSIPKHLRTFVLLADGHLDSPSLHAAHSALHYIPGPAGREVS